MKEVTMFVLAACPYCKKALNWMDELFAAHPEYRDIPLSMIDEAKQPEIAEQYDYYYVPTFYVGGEKVHEGAATAQIVKQVFDAARG